MLRNHSTFLVVILILTQSEQNLSRFCDFRAERSINVVRPPHSMHQQCDPLLWLKHCGRWQAHFQRHRGDCISIVRLYCFGLNCIVRFCCQKRLCRWDWGLTWQRTEVETHLVCVISCCGTCDSLTSYFSCCLRLLRCAPLFGSGLLAKHKTTGNESKILIFWHGPFLAWVCTMLVHCYIHLFNSFSLFITIISQRPVQTWVPSYRKDVGRSVFLLPEIAWVTSFDVCRGDDAHKLGGVKLRVLEIDSQKWIKFPWTQWWNNTFGGEGGRALVMSGAVAQPARVPSWTLPALGREGAKQNHRVWCYDGKRWRRLWTDFFLTLLENMFVRLECVRNQVMSDLFEHAVQGLANLRRCAHVGQSLVVELAETLKSSCSMNQYCLVSKAQISDDETLLSGSWVRSGLHEALKRKITCPAYPASLVKK